MSLRPSVVCCFLLVVASKAALFNPGVFPDLITRYTSPSECRNRPVDDYVDRANDCCYQSTSKSQCCIHVTSAVAPATKPKYKCICKPDAVCNLKSTTGCANENPDKDTNTDSTTDTGTQTKPDPNLDTDKETGNEQTTGRITGTKDSLCAKKEAGGRQLTFRLFGSTPVLNDCTYAGIAKIIKKDETKDLICNAVYTTAIINGKPQKTFVTPKFCIPSQREPPVDEKVNVQIGAQTYPVGSELIKVEDAGSTGTGLVYLIVQPDYANLFNIFKCQTPACVYKDDFLPEIDFGNCKMVSFGPTQQTDEDRDTELRDLKVYFDPFGCRELTVPDDVPYVCFRSTKKDSFDRDGDGGAALYCKAKSNNEDILVGVAAKLADDQERTIDKIPVLMLKSNLA